MEFALSTIIRSFDSVSQYANGNAEIFNGKEFMELHNNNIHFLEELAEERHCDYFKEKIAEYPPVSEEEVDQTIANRERRRNGNSFFGRDSDFWTQLPLISKLVSSGGKYEDDLQEKLQLISDINQNIIYVLKNPGMEELIMSAKSKKPRETKL